MYPEKIYYTWGLIRATKPCNENRKEKIRQANNTEQRTIYIAVRLEVILDPKRNLPPELCSNIQNLDPHDNFPDSSYFCKQNGDVLCGFSYVQNLKLVSIVYCLVIILIELWIYELQYFSVQDLLFCFLPREYLGKIILIKYLYFFSLFLPPLCLNASKQIMLQFLWHQPYMWPHSAGTFSF